MNKESYIVSCIRRLREYGEAIIIADQSISSLKEAAKSNVYTLLSLSQASQKDKREVISVLGLDKLQSKVINILEVGHGIIRLAGRYPYPQLLVFPFMKPKYFTDLEIDKINANCQIIKSLFSQAVCQTSSINKDQEVNKTFIQSNNSYNQNNFINPNTNGNSKSTKKIKKNLKRFLEAVVKNPYEKSTTILMNAKFSGSSGNKIKTYAIDRGYINEHKIHLGKKGNAGKYFEPTDKAFKLLDDLYIEYEKPKGKGAFEHRLYQFIIQNHFLKKGFMAKVEESNEQNESYNLIDVSVEIPDEERLAYEVEFHLNPHIIYNLEKNIDSGYNQIVVVTKKKQRDKIAKYVEKNLSNKFKEKVQIKSITEYI